MSWIKRATDFWTSDKIVDVGRDAAILFDLLLCINTEKGRNGVLSDRDVAPRHLSRKLLPLLPNATQEAVSEWLERLVEHELTRPTPDGGMALFGWEGEWVFARSDAERQRKSRAKKRHDGNVTPVVTGRDACHDGAVTPTVTVRDACHDSAVTPGVTGSDACHDRAVTSPVTGVTPVPSLSPSQNQERESTSDARARTREAGPPDRDPDPDPDPGSEPEAEPGPEPEPDPEGFGECVAIVRSLHFSGPSFHRDPAVLSFLGDGGTVEDARRLASSAQAQGRKPGNLLVHWLRDPHEWKAVLADLDNADKERAIRERDSDAKTVGKVFGEPDNG